MSEQDAKPTNHPAAIAASHHNSGPMGVGGGPTNGKDLLRQHNDQSHHHAASGN
jgi:hypothetical protein